MTTFDAETLHALQVAQEPRIRTDKHPTNAVVIWVVIRPENMAYRPPPTLLMSVSSVLLIAFMTRAEAW